MSCPPHVPASSPIPTPGVIAGEEAAPTHLSHASLASSTVGKSLYFEQQPNQDQIKFNTVTVPTTDRSNRSLLRQGVGATCLTPPLLQLWHKPKRVER